MVAMKGLTFVYYYNMLHLIENDIVRSALSGIERYFTSENVPCYTIIGSDSFHEKCNNLCCDYSVWIIDHDFHSHQINPLRLNVIINVNDFEARNWNIPTRANVLLMQKVKNSKLFSVFENKIGRMRLTHIWDGHDFIHAETLKNQKCLERNLKNEVMVIGTAFTPPYSIVKTLKNGLQIVGNGIVDTFLKTISARNEINLEWIDVLHKEKFIWGTLYENGTATGLVKYILEARIDVAPTVLCGIRLHRNLLCSKYVCCRLLFILAVMLPIFIGFCARKSVQ